MEQRDLVMQYGAILRKRFSSTQKVRYLSALSQAFKDLGYTHTIDARKTGRSKVYNLYAGDIDQADVIISSYYDTPARSFGLFTYNPVIAKSNAQLQFIAAILPVTILVILEILLVVFAVLPLWRDGSFTFLDLAAGGLMVLLLWLMICFSKGIANTYNVVRNTSGTIASLMLAQSISKQHQKKVAFAFTDFGCLNGLGETMLVERLKHRKKAPLVILLDASSGDGDVIVAHNNMVTMNTGDAAFQDAVVLDLKEVENAKINYYQRAIMITSGVRKDKDVLRSKVNSSKDIELNEQNFNKTMKLLQMFID